MSMETKLDRSRVPSDAVIHFLDLTMGADFAELEAGAGETPTKIDKKGSVFGFRIRGSDFARFQVKKVAVSSGLYSLHWIFQPRGRALGCMDNAGRLLPGVKPVAVEKGKTVYIGHIVMGVRVFPNENDEVSYPAALVYLDQQAPPADINDRLRAAGIDPGNVVRVPGALAACRRGHVKFEKLR
jgi:hypothetical protein